MTASPANRLNYKQALSGVGLDPREARLLLAEATGDSEASVIANPERVLTSETAATFQQFARRRIAGEPIAYVLGRKEFYGLELRVTPAVLVPRPETELLVDLALERAFNRAADIGTGSGAIAIALKRHRPNARVVGIEASAEALAVAEGNGARLGLDVDFRLGRFLDPLNAEPMDLIVANLPYVAPGDPHLAALRHEPQSALVGGGMDGLDDLRQLIRQAPSALVPGGWLLLEHGLGQEGAVLESIRRAGLVEAASWADLAGIPRVAGAMRPAGR